MLAALQARIGFTKTPANLEDGGIAFASFVSFAIGNSRESAALRKAFVRQHTSPDGESMKQHAAAFMDWLIVNHWGEAK